MNDVAIHRELPKLPERAVYPTLSRALTDAQWLVTAEREPPEGARGEAEKLLGEMAPLFAQPKTAQISNWLSRVNMATSQPISKPDFDLRSPAIIAALASLPAAVFTVETANAAALKFRWFPGAAEIGEFLAVHARRARDFERSLRQIVDAPAAPALRPEPTPEERAAVAAAVRLATGKGEIQPPIRTVEEQIAALRSA